MKPSNLAVVAVLSAALTAFAVPMFAQAPPAASHLRDNATPEQHRALLAAIDSWRQAVLHKNRVGLERVFHEDLSYGHTTGEVLNKKETIDRVLDSPNTYTAIDLSDVTIRVYGNVALIDSKIASHYTKDGAQSVAALSGIDVWIKGKHGWQLVARQLTRPKQ